MIAFTKWIFVLVAYLFFLPLGAWGVNSRGIKVTKYDTNQDGFADIITFKNLKDSITVEIRGGVVSRLEARQELNDISTVVHYIKKGNKFVANYVFATADQFFYNRSNCEPALVKDGKADLENIQINIESTFKFDKSCDLTPKLQNELDNFLKKLAIDSNRKAYSECLKAVDLEVASLWDDLPESLADMDFGCSLLDMPKGVFDKQKNKITVSNSCLGMPEEIRRVTSEEILHGLGIKNELLAKCLVSACPSMGAVNRCRVIANSTVGGLNIVNENITELVQDVDVITQLPTGISPSVAGTYNRNKGEVVQVRSRLTESEVPSLDRSFLKVVNPVTTSYQSDTVGSSTGRLMALAKAIFPNTAQAAQPTPIASSNSSRSQLDSRSPAAQKTSDGIHNLNKSSVSKPISEGTEASANPLVEIGSSSDPKAIVLAKPVGAKRSEIKSVELGQAKVSMKGNSLGENLPNIRGNHSTSRAPAAESKPQLALVQPLRSGDSAGGLSISNRTKQELIDILVDHKNYSKYLKSLHNDSFINALIENSITIQNVRGVKGNKIGHPNGKIILGDNGAKLVNYTGQ